MRYRDLPIGARRLIGLISLLALASVAIRLPDVATWSWQDVCALAGIALLAALSEQFTIAVKHETETENFSVTDALWAPMLVLAKPSVLTMCVVVGVALGHVARKWAWYKVVYNVAQFALAVTVAEFVYGLFRVPVGFSFLTLLACGTAMVTYLILNETLVAFAIARVEGVPLREVVLLPAGLNVLHAAGNLTVGMLAALVWSSGPVGVPLLIAPVVLSYLAYRGWTNTQHQAEQERERERMKILYEAGHALSGRLDASFDFKPFLALVRRLVDAAGVELITHIDRSLRVHSSESGLLLEVSDIDYAPMLEEYVISRPGLETYLAVVGDDPEIGGLLAVHRSPGLSPAEAALVDALASQVSVKQQNIQLFQETVQQQTRLSDVIGNSSDGILVVSADRRILSWNPAMHRITGFSRDEAVGRDCEDVLRVREEREDASLGQSRGLVLEAEGLQDVLVVRKDGSERWIRYTSSGMPDRGGGAKAYVIVARDVTAELEAERLKSDFVAMVSHELRTPLTPLKGLLLSLDQGTVDDADEARAEYYRIMLRQAERLEKLINDLLDVSRIDSGYLTLDSQIVELGSVLEREIEDAGRQPGAREVRFSRPDHDVWARVDPLRLGQVVSNLLSNSFKYSPAGSAVDVTLAVTDVGVQVAIHNRGEGVSLADQERVFDRFYRADNGLTQNVRGVGLGLYIARRLAEAMGGGLALSPSPDEGWTFVLTLPSLPLQQVGRVSRRSLKLASGLA